MHVIEVSRYGGPEVLQLAERPDPVPVDGKVRVRVAAATVNPTDADTREGWLTAVTPNAKPPIVLGWEFAGELLDPAPGFTVGQRVAGLYPWFALGDGTGTYAEIVLVSPDWLAPVPDGADLTEAVTISMNAQTALQALRIADVAEGRSLLVTGASGGVGGYAVQLAVANGVHVIAVASRGDEDYVASLGAQEVISRPGDTAELVAAVRERYAEGVDAALDAAPAGPELIGAVRDGGSYTSVTDPSTPSAERGVRVGTVHTQPDRRGLTDLLDRWVSGRLRIPRIVDVMPLGEAAEAHRRVAAGGVRGKIVLAV